MSTVQETTTKKRLDPVKYQIFKNRLYNILEEGRIAARLVTGSPVVAEGGETLCSFYTTDGVPILTATGILLHCTGAMDFVLKAIEWYEEEPGIHDGDQLFFNDPYIGGQHLPDQIIIKPIFHEGKRVAWCSTFMHTPEVGAIEPGGQPPQATNIWQEGLAVQGLKVIERGQFRSEVFNTICRHSRDPHLVGLDIKARIAANNVCAKNFLELIERYGIDFVEAASQQMIEDAEKMARAKLASLPDGIWRSRLYGDTDGLTEKPFKVVCTMIKKADEISFDFTGSSPQVAGSLNSTLAAARGSLFVVLASQLFWDIPWNGGMLRPVKIILPEGTVVNCRYPAACSLGVNTSGCMITETAHECIAKMFYATGMYDDINSAWRGGRGAGVNFGGKNQHGGNVAGVILEAFAAGVGATTQRDGVDTGGNMMNPTSSIADVEVMESNLPFLYLARRQATDSGGFGKYHGGMGPEMVYMIYGADNFRVGLFGTARRTPGNWGMFGGYPTAVQEARFQLHSDIKERFSRSQSITAFEELSALQGKAITPPNSMASIPVQNYDLLSCRLGAGGGYGDPLERDPQLVRRDVQRLVCSLETAQKVYGVALDPGTLEIDDDKTAKLRDEIRQRRLKEGRRLR